MVQGSAYGVVDKFALSLSLPKRRPFSFSGGGCGGWSPEPLMKDASAVYHIITSSPSPETMVQSLKQARVLLTNDLIDAVLHRARFSHANPFRALEFFRFSGNRKGFYHSASSYDTMLYILGRCRRFDAAWNLLVEMRKKDPALITPRTLHIVLGRVAKACSVPQTVKTFRRLRRFCTPFDTSCFNALLRNLCLEKSMADARKVYHSMKHDFRPSVHTFNILLSGWKSTEDAEAFFGEMRELGVKPDLVSYNCLVDVYCKNREVEKAFKVLDEMGGLDICPDVITYTSIIGGLGLVGQPDKARDVLKEMKEHGCYPDVAAYNAAIRNFCIAKRLNDGFALMEELATKGLRPNSTSYNLFFRFYYWANDLEGSWELYEKMRSEGCLPNSQSCMFLVKLCRRNDNARMGLELWKDMVEKGFGSFTLVSDVLLDILCDEGMIDEAELCCLQMIEKGQKPSNVSFRRIEVLMKLANRLESLENLSEKMEAFGHSHVSGGRRSS